MSEIEMPTFKTVADILMHVQKRVPEDYEASLRRLSFPDRVSWAVQEACYRRDEHGALVGHGDAREAFEAVLAVARVAKNERPRLLLTVDKFDFWLSPWFFETQDPVIYAMFWAASHLECDEFTVDETDEATVNGYIELISWGREAGVTAELIAEHASAIFRGNAKLAAQLGFAGCVEVA